MTWMFRHRAVSSTNPASWLRQGAATRWCFLGVCLIGLIAGADVGLGDRSIASVKAAPESVPRSELVVAAGRVEPLSEEIAVSNVTQGVLTGIPIKEGDQVKAGQLLAELNNDDLTAAVAAASAELDLRRSELEKLLNGARPEERRQADADLRATQSALAMAELTLERKNSLLADRFASVEAFDQARTDVQSARARRDSLAERFALVNAAPRSEDVAIAQANVKLAQAALDTAKATLDKTFIRTSIDGTVLRVLRHVGEGVSQTFPSIIAIVGDISRERIRAEIDETDIGRISVGQRAYAAADAYRDQRFTGVIVKIANRMGKKSIHSDDPAEKQDAKVLEALIDLDRDVRLPVGLRVDVFIEAGPENRLVATGREE
jgi:HlyD family secretion protein